MTRSEREKRENETALGRYSIVEDRLGRKAVYPVTIVKTRYQGAYEGGLYAAFPCNPDQVPDGWDSGDLTCSGIWDMMDKSRKFVIGRGDTPNEAMDDLKGRLYAYRRGE